MATSKLTSRTDPALACKQDVVGQAWSRALEALANRETAGRASETGSGGARILDFGVDCFDVEEPEDCWPILEFEGPSAPLRDHGGGAIDEACLRTQRLTTLICESTRELRESGAASLVAFFQVNRHVEAVIRLERREARVEAVILAGRNPTDDLDVRWGVLRDTLQDQGIELVSALPS